jgi:hypothetical protein
MQLITATLSPIDMSCVIGSISSKDLWTKLKEQFSTVSRTSIFQIKSNLQTIKKESDSISQYLHRIKEARVTTRFHSFTDGKILSVCD